METIPRMRHDDNLSPPPPPPVFYDWYVDVTGLSTKRKHLALWLGF